MKITKAVIPCAGLGTRFLPITKSVPKEILPIIDAPAISFIIDEAVDSGITDIMLVISPDKQVLKDYFLPNPKLMDALYKANRQDLADNLIKIEKKVNIVFEYQHKPLGSGDAVLKAASFTGNQPFCLAWGDDVIDARVPVMAQLMGAFEKTNSHIVGVQYWQGDDITKYGVAKIKQNDPAIKDLFQCDGFAEKPSLDKLPSRYAALGRYILTSEIYDEIKNTKSGKNGEFQLTDSINSLCQKSRVFGFDFVGKRYDMGDKLGAIKATIEFGIKREFGTELKEYLKQLAKSL